MKFIGVKTSFGGKRIPVIRKGDQIWFHFDGKNHLYEIPRENSSDLKESNGADGIYRATMPGKIMKIFVSEGQEVKQGSPLLVMEAMKMEYSMEAAFDGKIKTLGVSENAQVALGDLLIEMEKSEA